MNWNHLKTVLSDQEPVWDTYNPFTDRVFSEKRAAWAKWFREVWEYDAMPFLQTVQERLALHKVIRLRQRYLLTRANRMRLRYVAGMYMAAGFALVMAFAEPVSTIVSEFTAGANDAYYAAVEGGNTDNLAMTDVMQSQISEGMRRAAAAMKKAERPSIQTVEIGKGDTLAGVLEAVGVSGEDAYQAVKALSEYFDPRSVKPGQVVNVKFKPSVEEGRMELASMNMKIDAVKEVTVSKDDEEFVSDVTEKELVKRTYAYQAEIETSLYGSAMRVGIPQQVIAEVIRVYSWDIDFQRDIRRGDKIEVMYESEETEDGDFAKTGNVLFASLNIGGKEIPIYRYEMKDGRVDYFQPDGHSIRKTLMKTPIDGARISSGFGMRKHPILGYNKMHKGMDFAAPTGTPIYAAGDGVVDFAGRQNGYGNYVRLRHNGTLKTAYAHMHRFAKGISKGKRVSQGDVIGYVGTTGRSTGPHLHYEVLVNNAQVNPKSLNLPTGEQLEGGEFKNFKAQMNKIHQQYVSLTEGMKFAQVLGGRSAKQIN